MQRPRRNRSGGCYQRGSGRSVGCRGCSPGARAACGGEANVMEAVVEAARHDVTLGEICKVVREVFGEYRDPAQI